MQRYDWTFLEDLGYDQADILRLGENWSEGIRQMLADETFREEYVSNIQLAQTYLEPELVLELAAEYPGAFALEAEYFDKRLAQLAKRIPDWRELIQLQLRTGDPNAIFEHMGESQSRWCEALDRQESPRKMEWSLVTLVRETAGVQLDAHWLLREHGMEYLLSLESARYEIAENAKVLAEAGVRNVDELICHHAWPFQYPVEEFAQKLAVLQAQWGDALADKLEDDLSLFRDMY